MYVYSLLHNIFEREMESSSLWDWRQTRYRFVYVDRTVFGTIYHVASFLTVTAMDRCLISALTAPRPPGIDDYERPTPVATVYPHLVPGRSVRRFHECRDGGFMAVSLYTAIAVHRSQNGSRVLHRDSKWCSTGCTRSATGTGPDNLAIEYAVVKFATLDALCDWFPRHRCYECGRYLARLISPTSFGGHDPPANGQFFPVPFGYGGLWNPSYMKIVAHH